MPTLSEAASKDLLRAYGVPVLAERTAADADRAAAAAADLGFPVVVKLCGDAIAHKTERGLVRLGLRDAASVHDAATQLLAAARPDDGDVELLVAPMLRGNRELIAGLHHDPQFGPTVMLGVGGILAEAVADVSFRLAPIERVDAEEMIDELKGAAILKGARGREAVSREAIVEVLMKIGGEGGLLMRHADDIAEADINPLIVSKSGAVAVDARFILK